MQLFCLRFVECYLLYRPCTLCFAGVLGFFILVGYEQMTLNAKAESMKAQIADELPRFLDLLQAELQIGMPIEMQCWLFVKISIINFNRISEGA